MFMWDPEYASGRVSAAIIVSLVDLRLQKNFSGRFGTGTLGYIFSFVTLCISTYLGKFLFQFAGGPPINSSGCIFVSFFVLTLFRFTLWIDQRYES